MTRSAALIFGLAISILQVPTTSLASGIKWHRCSNDKDNKQIECGELQVPLDYTNLNSKKTIPIKLSRVTASKKNSSAESVIINFGGPGIRGTLGLDAYADKLRKRVGDQYDIVSFDPRGTADDLPLDCYDTLEDSKAALGWPLLVSNATENAYGVNWATSQIYAKDCADRIGRNGTLVGTGFVARDVMRIASALSKDGLLNYYGLSYGTILGATLATMFPQRIRRMVLDGVVDPDEYYHGQDLGIWGDNDAMFAAFLSACIENPEKCALAKHGKTADELASAVDHLLELLKSEPRVVGSTLIDYSAAVYGIRLALYSPESFPNLAKTLNNLLDNTGSHNRSEPLFGTFEMAQRPDDTSAAISCGDKVPRATTLDAILPALEKITQQSNITAGVNVWSEAVCAQWKFKAKGAYNGTFNNITTKNPVLIVNNKVDPVTPLALAKNLTGRMTGSALMQQDGFGHTTLSQNSTCTDGVVRAYYQNGTFPATGKVCTVDEKLWPEGSEDEKSRVIRRWI